MKCLIQCRPSLCQTTFACKCYFATGEMKLEEKVKDK